MKKMLSGSIKEVYIEMNTGSNHKLNNYLEKIVLLTNNNQ